MGLKGAGAHFQQMMATLVLKGIVCDGVEVYIDDIIIHAKTEEEFARLVGKVFKRLAEFNIIIHPDKCHLGLQEIEILGHTITQEGVTFSDAKCAMIANFEKPIYQQQLKSFLGLANYFRESISNYAIITHPLHELLKAYNPRKTLIWSDTSDKAFEEIRSVMRNLPKRFFLVDDLEIVVETDASDYGIGAFLYQIEVLADGTKIKKPVEFISKSLTPTQQRWNTTEKECYAIVFALTKWSSILSDRKFTLYTDHENLQYINDTGSDKVLRWKLLLQEFDVSIIYIKGIENIVADSLSRCVEMTDASKEPVIALVMCLSWSSDIALKQEIKSIAAQALLVIGASDDKLIRAEFLKIHNNVSGHPKLNPTMKLISKLEGLGPLSMVRGKVKQLIKECTNCQLQNRISIKANTLPFTISATAPMQKVCIDSMGPFPTDIHGNKYILVMTCAFSRWVEVYPLKTLESTEAATCMIDFFTRFQAPEKILTDNGSQFQNQIMKQLFDISGIESLKTIPYSSQENGIGERINREIIKHLEAFCRGVNEKQRWSEYLPFVRRIINGSHHSSIGTSPASIIYGNRIDTDWIFAPSEYRDKELGNDTFGEYMSRSLMLQDEVILEAEAFQNAINEKHIEERAVERSKIPFQSFQVGDWVLMEGREQSHGLKRPKLQTARLGPYKIVEKSGNSYTIKRPDKARGRVVRVDQLVKYLYDKATTDPEEVAIENIEDLYIVEAIEGFKGKPGAKDIQFRIRWKDYPDERDKTWSSFANLHANGTVNIIFQEWLQQKMKEDKDPKWKSYIRAVE